jgi:hypothetical protein
MSYNTMLYGLYRMGYHSRATVHGFRAMASTALNEMGFPPDVIERQLAHQEPNAVRAAYNRAEYLGERRAMMKYWADCVDVLREGGRGAAVATSVVTANGLSSPCGACRWVHRGQLGHADTRMTEKHYAHLAPSYVADTIRAHFPTLGIAEESIVTPKRYAAESPTIGGAGKTAEQRLKAADKSN